MLLIHPRGNRSRGRTEDDANAGRVQFVDNTIHPAKLKLSTLRFPQTPAKFANAHHADACFLHELNVLVQPLVRHVFRIVGNAVKHRVHPVGAKRSARLCSGKRWEKGESPKEKTCLHGPQATSG